MRQFRHHHAFTPAWFESSLWWLRRVFNAPIVGRWLRRQMGLSLDGRVVDVRPDAVIVQFNENDYQYVGWTGDVVSQFVYETAKPLWWAIHYWDEWIADRWIPQLSYGFNVLDSIVGGNTTGPPEFRRYTDSDSATTNAYDVAISCEATTYANARNGATGSVFNVWRTQPAPFVPLPLQASVSQTNLPVTAGNPLPIVIYRSFLHFNTSAMAGNRGQFIPGRISVTWASVIVMPEPSGNLSPGPLVLCRSTIDPTKAISSVVGSDYQQTPVSAPVDLATTRESGTRTDPRNASNQIISIVPGSVPGSTNRPACYQWILKSGDSSTLSEIESYYYPPSFGTYGVHNGLARFCIRPEAEFLNQSSSERLNVIYSRETAEAASLRPQQAGLIYYTPRLIVNYTRAEVVDVLSMKGTNQFNQPTDRLTQFGLATITSPRRVTPPSITSNANPFIAQPLVRFGTPNIQPGRELKLPSMPLFTRFGVPMITSLFFRGFGVTVNFGLARVIPPVTPSSITRSGNNLVAFGSHVIESGPTVYPTGFKVREEDTATLANRFGRARIDIGAYEIKPLSVPRGTQFGQRTAIGHPFPDEIYANQIQDLPLQYQTVSFEFDGGRIENNVQVCGVRQWRIVYDGLSEEDVATLVAHFNKVQGRVGLFPFYHRRDQVTYENCRYVAFDIPSRLKKWSNAVTITIEREE